ncbi:MAG: class I tRNA ligase family protein, partial [Anaerolineae bacterium]|nr:class I tRNA ligase family protein [Phycisphaerae bacterium]
EANPIITEDLKKRDALFADEKLTHSYPHDWRSKKPTIFRATEQWFIAMDKPFTVSGASEAPRSLRARALASLDKTTFHPDWGKARLRGMIESRPDWCISRQRSWGLPIPVFYNENGDALLTPESVRAVSKHFHMNGADAWFDCPAATMLGADFKFPPGFSKDSLRKEKDIFDVWFESGSSWRAVLQCRSYLKYPADLYLEGSDQHRGWFQLSMLNALSATGEAPFNEVLTHGFIVKPDGTKVSKSDKEYVTATQEVDRHGADLLRLWTSSVDYQKDVPASPQAIKEFGDKYRKIRNTLRFLLSNLYDFNPKTDAVDVPPNSLDGWALAQLDQLITDVTAGYEAYELHHRVFRPLHDFCSVQVSAIYAASMKDRLYCEAPNSPLRRRCQTVMHRMVVALTKLLAPILVFTADETWEFVQHKPDEDCDLASIHMTRLPHTFGRKVSDEQREEWSLLMDLRSQAMSQIDALLRKFPKQIKPLDLEVIYRVDDDAMRRKLQAYGPDLEDIVGAGSWRFAEKSSEGASVNVEVVDRRETYKACARSWKRRGDVGQDAEYPDVTLRDANALRGRGA